ncbi:kinase-like domain-containing protein, partial [Achaetomium macrosporum]
QITLNGRHGDIKPSNILWFAATRTLKLTDFGLAEFHTILSRAGQSSSGLAVSPDYRPPEMDVDGGKVSRPYDIWSMGCIYLELIAWLLEGYDLVQRFRAERTLGAINVANGQKSAPFFELQRTCETKRIQARRATWAVQNLHTRTHTHTMYSAQRA